MPANVSSPAYAPGQCPSSPACTSIHMCMPPQIFSHYIYFATIDICMATTSCGIGILNCDLKGFLLFGSFSFLVFSLVERQSRPHSELGLNGSLSKRLSKHACEHGNSISMCISLHCEERVGRTARARRQGRHGYHAEPIMLTPCPYHPIRHGRHCWVRPRE